MKNEKTNVLQGTATLAKIRSFAGCIALAFALLVITVPVTSCSRPNPEKQMQEIHKQYEKAKTGKQKKKALKKIVADLKKVKFPKKDAELYDAYKTSVKSLELALSLGGSVLDDEDYDDLYEELETILTVYNIYGDMVDGKKSSNKKSSSKNNEKAKKIKVKVTYKNPNDFICELGTDEYNGYVVIKSLKNSPEDYCCIEFPAEIEGMPTAINKNFYFNDKYFDNKEYLVEVKIPEGWTEIPSGTFSDSENLKKVTFPSSLRKVGGFARTGLESVELPEGVEFIDDNCFKECKNLKTVKLPSTVKKIYDYAFNGCKNLKTVNLPSSLTYCGWHAFDGDSNLSELEIPETLEDVGFGVSGFGGCSSLPLKTQARLRELGYGASF